VIKPIIFLLVAQARFADLPDIGFREVKLFMFMLKLRFPRVVDPVYFQVSSGHLDREVNLFILVLTDKEVDVAVDAFALVFAGCVGGVVPGASICYLAYTAVNRYPHI